MVYSDAGLNGMSQIFHKLYRTRLVRGKYRDEVRPILINNWEGTYFDFDEEKILKIAGKAKELGIELFVLDDGAYSESVMTISPLWATGIRICRSSREGLPDLPRRLRRWD